MSLWAFRLVLLYICILLIQPQNRFLFLYPYRIAMMSMVFASILHFVSASQEGRPIIRMGPATKTALLLLAFSFISWKFGVYQTDTAWNSDMDMIVKNCICLILVEAMAYNVERVWAVLGTIMFSTLWWVKGGLRLAGADATYSGDRLMGPAVSIIENPNSFAYFMTLMIPLYLYFYQKSQYKYIRIAFLVLALASVYIVLQTGSRTGMLTLIVVGVFLMPKYGSQHKAAIIVGAIAIFIFSTSIGALNAERFKTIPDSIYSFLFEASEEKDPLSMNQDELSAWERSMKSKHTWILILDFPLGVGVQPDDDLIYENYTFATGQVHNEILYAGKQMGFIGMGIYLSFMIIIFSYGRKIQIEMKDKWPALQDLGWTLKMQAIVFAVGGFFSPIPWNPLYLIIAACASALWTNIQNKSWNAATTHLEG